MKEMPASTPLHIAIIPDGNRRWAKAHGLVPWKGHEQSLSNLRAISDWCQENPRVGTLTLWCLSTENWKRDPQEIAHLFEMLETYIRKERPNMTKYKTRLLHSGRSDRMPVTLAKLIEDVCEESKDFNGFHLHLAIDYGGKDEVTRAVRKLRDHFGEVTEDDIRANLDHPELPDIDLIIRTSGEQRTSNFFLWQSAYAEWTFSPKYLPDFTLEDFQYAVDAFLSRSRRFGA
jgi:undecaprenyl diphosphate synthase